MPLSHVCSDRTQKLLKPLEESTSEGAVGDFLQKRSRGLPGVRSLPQWLKSPVLSFVKINGANEVSPLYLSKKKNAVGF